MDSLDYIVNKVLDVIKRDTKKKTSSYDAVGTVTRVQDNIAWVHFDNGVSETPVAMSIHCSKGDKVHVRVTNGTAFITGNETAPPSDDTEALVAKAVAKLADSKAESAEATAADAQETAENAANTAGTSLVTDTMHYLATNLSSGVTTSTAGWTTTVQTIDATKKYLWTYHTYTKANDVSTDTTPVLTGRYGEDGTSVSILGSYSTYADLIAAHPTGNTGEAYMVGNDLYVWNGTAWEDVGQIKGDTGVGVASIAKTGTSGLVDTYTITYTDNSTSTYTVTNGQKGDTGAAGANGKTPYIQSGYWYIDGTSTGVKAEGDDGNTPYIQNGYWYIGGTSTGIKAEGTNGTSVTAVQPQYYNHTSPTATQQEIDLWQWTTTLTYDANNPYIWTRDLVTYSNSTTTASQAIYNEALTTACADAIQALALAQNVEQHFWNETSGTEAGAHITEVSQEDWSDSTSANYHTGANLLLRSNTIKLRNALVTLAELSSVGLKVYEPNDSTNPVAQFLNTGAVVGKQTDRYTIFTQNGSEYWDGTNNHRIGTRTFYYSNYAGRIDDRAVSNTLSNTFAGTFFRTYSENSDVENEAALQSQQGANGVRAASFYARAGHTSEGGEYTELKGQISDPAGFDSFEYHIDPATARGEFDLGRGKIVAGNFDAGSGSLSSVASGTTDTVPVSFNKTFTSAPMVVVGFTYNNTATGTSNSFGNCAISAISVSTTGFTAKFYNGSGSSKSPSFNWIALLP